MIAIVVIVQEMLYTHGTYCMKLRLFIYLFFFYVEQPMLCVLERNITHLQWKESGKTTNRFVPFVLCGVQSSGGVVFHYARRTQEEGDRLNSISDLQMETLEL